MDDLAALRAGLLPGGPSGAGAAAPLTPPLPVGRVQPVAELSRETEQAVLGFSRALITLMGLGYSPARVPNRVRRALDEGIAPPCALFEPILSFMWEGWPDFPLPRPADAHQLVHFLVKRMGMGTREVVLAYVILEQTVRLGDRYGYGVLRTYTARKLVLGACLMARKVATDTHNVSLHASHALLEGALDGLTVRGLREIEDVMLLLLKYRMPVGPVIYRETAEALFAAAASANGVRIPVPDVLSLDAEPTAAPSA